MAESEDRKKRKEEGRLQKRQRIDESGGVRPRKNEEGDGSNESSAPKKASEVDNASYSSRNTTTSVDRRPRPKQFTSSSHRFGRVMEIVPCRNKPRYSTLSIALPGSVLANCQTRELRTLLVGQIARAATIYHVDEIIVFDDKLAKNENRDNGGWRRPRDRDDKRTRESRLEKEKIAEKKAEKEKTEEKKTEDNSNAEGAAEPQDRPRFQKSDPQTFMARLLQYCECPQYLRRHFFPMHPDLQFAGLLAPVDAPHHVRAEDRSKYREGVVLEKKSPRPDGGSLVNCGIRNRPVEYVYKLRRYVFMVM
jgi:predicted SPOUT superfamily RNA methylase MTH1